MTKRIFERPGVVFAAVYAWKIALLVFTAQPIPSNDSFFYDGPVVNFLLHGKYANPSLALALPISGLDVFCAYPPLYQAALLGWMSVFGTTVMSAMVFHLVLFGIYLIILVAILRRLDLPIWVVHISALFVLAMTFHDRPDSLAHVFGMAALYCWIRSRPPPGRGEVTARPGWLWGMSAFVVLSLCTGLQIGGLYFLVIWIGVLAARFVCGESFPWSPMLGLIFAPAGLVALVVFGFPHLWAGFLEHARQTPALSGWRVPLVGELLKFGRSLPGIIAAALGFPWLFKRRLQLKEAGREGLFLVTLACTLAGLAMGTASMFVLTANAVGFSAYLQPVAVAGYLALVAGLLKPLQLRRQAWAFLGLAALGSIRAVGMTTWGAVCAADVSEGMAVQRVGRELETIRDGQAVVLSSAYLYTAAPHTNFRWIHSDWLVRAKTGLTDREGLVALKPAKLVLTQFDYYRRFQYALDGLKSQPELVDFQITNVASVRPPDATKSLQKVVQHISWAPIIVNFSWK